MRFRLRTLLIVLAILPPILAVLLWTFSPQVAYELARMAVVMASWCLFFLVFITAIRYGIPWGIYFIRCALWYVRYWWWRYQNRE
jgi:hypothetical protein